MHMTDKVWGDVSPLLDMALDRGGEDTLESTKADIEAGRGLLIVAMESSNIIAAGLLELIKYPLKTIVMFKLCGGRDMSKWLPQGLAVIKSLAKEQGAEEIQIIGRKGWSKLPGFTEKFRAYSLEV
jgi:hypothetical protein